MSDASNDGITFGPLKRAFGAAVNLCFTRGNVSIGVHNHATKKYSGRASWNVRWDNVAFDGPVLEPNRVGQVDNAASPNGGGIEIAYDLSSGTTTGRFDVSDVTTSGATSARLVFNLMADVSNNDPATINVRYRLNGTTWHDLGLTADELAVAGQRASTFSFSRSVDLAEVRDGSNLIVR